MTCLILVGGLGTRLRAALSGVPKPMAPVHGRPFLEHLLMRLKAASITKIILCVGFRAEMIEEYFGDGARFGLQIEYSRERELLGTAGAMALARPLVKTENFLLLNGDCYNEVDYHTLMESHQSTSQATATIVATHAENRARYGSLKLGSHSQIIGFREKGADAGAGLINAGAYALNRRVFEEIPAGEVCSLEHQVFPRLIEKGELFAFVNSGSFIDIGLPEDWQRAGEILPTLQGG